MTYVDLAGLDSSNLQGSLNALAVQSILLSVMMLSLQARLHDLPGFGICKDYPELGSKNKDKDDKSECKWYRGTDSFSAYLIVWYGLRAKSAAQSDTVYDEYGTYFTRCKSDARAYAISRAAIRGGAPALVFAGDGLRSF